MDVNCQDVFVRLSADIDGALPAVEAGEVRLHLTSCAECARKRALLDDTRRAFRSVEVRPAPARHAGALWLSGAMATAMLVGFVLIMRPPFAPERPRAIQPLVQVSAEQLSPASGDAHVGADCGLPGSAVCVVEAPCRDGQCAPAAALVDLR